MDFRHKADIKIFYTRRVLNIRHKAVASSLIGKKLTGCPLPYIVAIIFYAIIPTLQNA